MPISSGAGGKAARLHLVNSASGGVGAKSRTYWPNAAAHTTTKSHSTSALHQAISVVSSRPTGASSSSSVTNLNQQQLSASSSSGSKTNLEINHEKPEMSSNSDQKQHHRHQQRTATVEKYKQIRHISPPSSHATTSPTAFKYFTGGSGNLGDNIASQSRPESPESSSAGPAREIEVQGQAANDRGAVEQAASRAFLFGKQQARAKSKRNKMISSLGGQLIVTGDHQQQQPHEQPIRGEPNGQQPKPASGGLFSSLMTLGGGGGQKAATGRQHSRHQSHNYSRAATINQHSSQASLNPSLSFVSGNQSSSSSASSSAANLHSLASLHGGGGGGGGLSTTTTINKRINLKYVKTLIILLMSLDLVVTLFVHHFASNDEFALIFTQHKLRFSLVNLALSAIWFMVLATAILFDIYAILLIGALIDIASLILLLVCSVIHFTHRIDYNTVNLTSLLLLLFSIIVLHVYLIVIAALTVYLMMAVKRRRKH